MADELLVVLNELMVGITKTLAKRGITDDHLLTEIYVRLIKPLSEAGLIRFGFDDEDDEEE